MLNKELTLTYLTWIIIILTTIGLFNIFSKKEKSTIILVFLTLIPVWIFAAIIKGLIYLYVKNSEIIFDPLSYINLLAETLPITFIFGGLTFYFKYRKFKKYK